MLLLRNLLYSFSLGAYRLQYFSRVKSRSCNLWPHQQLRIVKYWWDLLKVILDFHDIKWNTFTFCLLGIWCYLLILWGRFWSLFCFCSWFLIFLGYLIVILILRLLRTCLIQSIADVRTVHEVVKTPLSRWQPIIASV